MSETLKQKVFSGMFWSGLGQVWSYGVNFTISVILARLLAPEEFGITAIIGVFIAIFSVFIDSGFSSALIQKKDLQEVDCSSVFFLNLVMAMLLYTGLFFAAPYISGFYDKPILTPCIRVSALTMVIGSWSIVQGTMIYRRMQFHLNFRISLVSQSVSGVVGVVMAFKGFGVWALVTQSVLKTFISTVFLWIWGTWRPILAVNFQRLKEMFDFGGKLFFSGILDCLYNNLYPVLFGKLFNFSTLAYYNRGNHIPSLGMGIINSTIGSVLFPAFSSIQDDRARMKRVMKRIFRAIMFMVIPAMALLFIVSEPLIVLIFKEKWLPAVPYMRVFCFIFMLFPFHTANLQLLNSCGRSDVFLILEVIKKVQTVVIILLTFRHGPLAMVFGAAAGSVLSVVENSWMSRKLVGYGIGEQVRDVLPYLLVGVVSGAAGWFVCSAVGGLLLKLFAAGAAFGVSYLLLSFLLKLIPEDIIRLISEKLKLRRSIEK